MVAGDFLSDGGMVRTRQKGSRGKKGLRKKVQWKWPAILAVCMATLGLLVCYALYRPAPQSTSKPVRPFYEEIYSGRGNLNVLIKSVDRLLSDALYQSGVPQKDIYFLEVQPRHEKGRVWEFTELMVRHLNADRFDAILRSVTKGLEKLGPDARLQKVQGPAQNVLAHVYLQGCHTHKILLSQERLSDAERPHRPELAIIIDDLGYDLGLGLSLVDLDESLSLSVLPYAPFTGRIVRAANERGRELMLHLPMEPRDYPTVHPGPGALLVGMEDRDLRGMVSRNLMQIHGAVGVNNHMGSYFTEHREKMGSVLDEIRKRGLFYVDSRTSNATVGYDLGKGMGMAVGKRSVFLDNELDTKAIRLQIERAVSMARQSGSAIGIAHPHAQTVEALKDILPKIRSEVRLVRASQAVDR
jgi:hypothetical protein